MPSSSSNRRSTRSRLGTVLILAGAVLLGWVGLRVLEREAAQRQARAELQSRAGIAALAVSAPPAWSADAVTVSELELPDEPPGAPREGPPRQSARRKTGRLIGRIVAPQVGVDAMAFEGIDLPTLDLGAGHFPGTPLPGRPGNVSFAGHRNTDFSGLRDIEVGHSIYVETGGETYVYHVAETRIVEPTQVDVVAFRGRDELTLVTCHPFDWVGPAPRRFIVHADFVRAAPEGAPDTSR